MIDGKEISRKAAEQDYIAGMKYKDIAEKYGVTMNTIKSWKQRYKWQRNSTKKCAHKNKKSVHTKKNAHVDNSSDDNATTGYELDTIEMTAQQRLFADEYLIDLNATQAAIRAGYSPRTAQEQSSQLLSKLIISDYIARRLAERSRRLGISLDRSLNELAKIGYANPKDFINPNTGEILPGTSPDDLAAITSVKVKASESEKGNSIEREIKFNNKINALQTLLKYRGLTKQEQKSNEIELERLKLEREKLEIQRKSLEAKNPPEEIEQEDDGFLAALEGKSSEVWSENSDEKSSKNE